MHNNDDDSRGGQSRCAVRGVATQPNLIVECLLTHSR